MYNPEHYFKLNIYKFLHFYLKSFLSLPQVSHICLDNRIKSQSQAEELKYRAFHNVLRYYKHL